MRFVLASGTSVELNYMWLPTWLGQNLKFKRDLEEKLGPELMGQELTAETLDHAHQRVIDIVCDLYPLAGLRDYLDGVKFVETDDG